MIGDDGLDTVPIAALTADSIAGHALGQQGADEMSDGPDSAAGWFHVDPVAAGGGRNCTVEVKVGG